MSVAPPEGRERLAMSRNDWLAFLIGTAIVAAAFALLFLPGETVDWLVEEDGPIEWIGAVGLFLASGLFFASFRVARRRGAEAVELSKLGVWMLFVVGAGMLFAACEEISWGQRIFGYGEPSIASDVNAQGELNLHNLNLFQGGTIDGDRLFRLGYFALFVFLPLGVWASRRLRDRLSRTFPIVPLWLAGLFLMAWVLAEIVKIGLDGLYPSSATFPLTHSISEVLESSVEAMTAIAAFLSLQRSRLFGRALAVRR